LCTVACGHSIKRDGGGIDLLSARTRRVLWPRRFAVNTFGSHYGVKETIPQVATRLFCCLVKKSTTDEYRVNFPGSRFRRDTCHPGVAARKPATCKDLLIYSFDGKAAAGYHFGGVRCGCRKTEATRAAAALLMLSALATPAMGQRIGLRRTNEDIIVHVPSALRQGKLFPRPTLNILGSR